MLCKYPYQKTRTGIVHPVFVKGSSGYSIKPGIHIKGSDDYLKDVTPYPCGQCLHCRINQSRVWQTRLLLENMTALDSTFLTLTYDDDHVPWNYHLVKSHLTKFLKRYRKRLGHKIRYFAVGEYGDETWRPHFHLAVFAENVLERCRRSCEDMRKRDQCTQDCIARLAWKQGNISVTQKLNKELAGYITGYIKKKATKERRINRPNEYSTMSRKGGIGRRAIREIGNQLKTYKRHIDVSKIATINHRGRPAPIGRYLSESLADSLGISQCELGKQFSQYALQLLSETLERGMTVPNLLKNSAGKRKSQEVRTEIFTKRRKQI